MSFGFPKWDPQLHFEDKGEETIPSILAVDVKAIQSKNKLLKVPKYTGGNGVGSSSQGNIKIKGTLCLECGVTLRNSLKKQSTIRGTPEQRGEANFRWPWCQVLHLGWRFLQYSNQLAIRDYMRGLKVLGTMAQIIDFWPCTISGTFYFYAKWRALTGRSMRMMEEMRMKNYVWWLWTNSWQRSVIGFFWRILLSWRCNQHCWQWQNCSGLH